MASWIALLQNPSPDPGTRLPMAVWRQLAFHAGARNPRTYLQSGNLVFDADKAESDEVIEQLAEAMQHKLETQLVMVVRSGVEVLEATRRSPFHAEASEDPTAVFVGFLSEAPDARKVDALDPGRSETDRFAVAGREVHLHFAGDPTKSTLTEEWFTEQLGVDCVFRSWRTVERLVEMADPPREPTGPGLRGLSYVMLMVTDMARSVAFYRDSLGLECTLDTPYWSEFRAGSTRIALHAGGKGEPPAGDTAGTASLGFEVSDLDGTYAQLKKAGVRFVQEPQERPQEGIKLAVATDPDGLTLNFAQVLPRQG